MNETMLGVSHAHIWEVLKGKRKTAGGFRWEYEEALKHGVKESEVFIK